MLTALGLSWNKDHDHEKRPPTISIPQNEKLITNQASIREIRARPIDLLKPMHIKIVEPHMEQSLPTPLKPTQPEYTNNRASPNILVPRYKLETPDNLQQSNQANGADTAATSMRRYRRVSQRISVDQQPVRIEYELDQEDEAWLQKINSGHEPPLLDAACFEEIVDAFERASYSALFRGQKASWKSQISKPDPSYPAQNRASRVSKVSKPNTSRLEKPPEPTDEELRDLPTGLCRRYQQRRCHKGRSCKWKHEIWPALQQKWDNWYREREKSVEEERVGHLAQKGDVDAVTKPCVNSPPGEVGALKVAHCSDPDANAAIVSWASSWFSRGRNSDRADRAKSVAESAFLVAASRGKTRASTDVEFLSNELETAVSKGDFGVPPLRIREIVQGPLHTLQHVWLHWHSKRLRDADGLPLLPFLRMESKRMLEHANKHGVATESLRAAQLHLFNTKKMLDLVWRREKLKRQIALIDGALFESKVSAHARDASCKLNDRRRRRTA